MNKNNNINNKKISLLFFHFKNNISKYKKNRTNGWFLINNNKNFNFFIKKFLGDQYWKNNEKEFNLHPYLSSQVILTLVNPKKSKIRFFINKQALNENYGWINNSFIWIDDDKFERNFFEIHSPALSKFEIRDDKIFSKFEWIMNETIFKEGDLNIAKKINEESLDDVSNEGVLEKMLSTLNKDLNNVKKKEIDNIFPYLKGINILNPLTFEQFFVFFLNKKEKENKKILNNYTSINFKNKIDINDESNENVLKIFDEICKYKSNNHFWNLPEFKETHKVFKTILEKYPNYSCKKSELENLKEIKKIRRDGNNIIHDYIWLAKSIPVIKKEQDHYSVVWFSSLGQKNTEIMFNE